MAELRKAALITGAAKRIGAFMEKATREAKEHTSWINPYAEYDRAVAQFVASGHSRSSPVKAESVSVAEK
jgi:maltooligosyltrehalose synthase